MHAGQRSLQQRLQALAPRKSLCKPSKAVATTVNLLLEEGCAVLEVIEARGAFLRQPTPFA